MSDVIKFINNALDEWYKSGKKTSPKGFNLKMLREDVEKLKDSNRDIRYKNGQGQ